MEKKVRMSSTAWIWMFLGTILLIALLIGLFNYLMDPYGMFGDPLLDWWSYNETMNPRGAKISYLKEHHEEYDSYVIGSSDASAYPIEELNEYLDASFYNCFFYGTDMVDFELIANYLAENYEVKNLLMNLPIGIAYEYDVPEEDRTTYHYSEVDGSSGFLRSLKYLVNTPADGWTKLTSYWSDGYLQEPYDVFNSQTGAYDKSRRDVEHIGDLASYLQKEQYSVFTAYPQGYRSLNALEEAMAAVARIKALCEEKGIRLIVTCHPAYYASYDDYSVEDQARFRNALAQVTEYWDFSLSSVSYEPRYFYDGTHYRNAVGSMALGRIFGNEEMYIPEDFGRFVPLGSQPDRLVAEKRSEDSYTCRVPILMYHHLVEDGGQTNADTVQVSTFRAHMEALKAAGYEPVSLQALQDYVEKGTDLPEKPVVITFDDGYSSNYELAYPILKEFDFPATIFAIGVSMGKDTYKDTGVSMNPHFSVEEAEEMEASGLVTVGSHGYNIHEVEGRDQEPLRKGVLQKETESEEDYLSFLEQDFKAMESLLGDGAKILAYPFGAYSELSEVALSQMGVYMTFTTEARVNTLVKGLPQSLRQLGRFRVTEEQSGEDLLAMLEIPQQ